MALVVALHPVGVQVGLLSLSRAGEADAVGARFRALAQSISLRLQHRNDASLGHQRT